MDVDSREPDPHPADQPAFDVDIDDVILSLHAQHMDLSQHIDRHWHDLDASQLARLLALHAENATRLGRLLRDHCAIHGEPDDPMDAALIGALDILSQVWDIDLLDADQGFFHL